jgi:hypothetical protein
MAKISISNLSISGAELFADTETYLYELTETEMDMTKGGYFYITAPTVGPTDIMTPIPKYPTTLFQQFQL